MLDYDVSNYSYQDTLKLLEADIQHANLLAASTPIVEGGAYIQMKLVYNQLAPIYLFLLQWLDWSSTCLLPGYLNLFHIRVYKVCPDGRMNIATHGRRATIREFYAMILPSLQRLCEISPESNDSHTKFQSFEVVARKRIDERRNLSKMDLEREDECGICLEQCTKMVLPNCCHAMCINCYRDWNTRSESCPFCRGSLKRVDSGDLWVLTDSGDMVDNETISKADKLRFYLYIHRLPKDSPDALFFVHYEYLI